MAKPSITDVRKLKASGLNTFTAVTAVSYWQAKCASQAGVAVLNVNDVSYSRLLMGRPAGNDFQTTLDEIIECTKAVKRGSGDSLVITSLPFGYYAAPAETLQAVTRVFKEAGCDAIHLEGASVECIKTVCDAGWPVLGHAGVTKVNISQTGECRMKGKTKEEAQAIFDYAVELEKAGCFCVVLECIPTELARIITEKLDICTCGIGAGQYCNGQFLVSDDLLGSTVGFEPKFLKRYADLDGYMTDAYKAFVTEVTTGQFPDNQHRYDLKDNYYLNDIR